MAMEAVVPCMLILQDGTDHTHHPSCKDILSAEQRVEENVFYLFCCNHRDTTSIYGQAAAIWSSHWCSVAYSLKCTWG